MIYRTVGNVWLLIVTFDGFSKTINRTVGTRLEHRSDRPEGARGATEDHIAVTPYGKRTTRAREAPLTQSCASSLPGSRLLTDNVSLCGGLQSRS